MVPYSILASGVYSIVMDPYLCLYVCVRVQESNNIESALFCTLAGMFCYSVAGPTRLAVCDPHSWDQGKSEDFTTYSVLIGHTYTVVCSGV